MDALEESIEVREYDIGPGELEYCISFRLPEHSGPEEEWNLHIAGRTETCLFYTSVLALIYYLYQREFFFAAVISALGLLGVKVVPYHFGFPAIAYGYAVVLGVALVGAVVVFRVMQAAGGKLRLKGNWVEVLPKSANYALLYVTCGVVAAVVIAALLLGGLAVLYGVLVAWLLILAVYYTCLLYTSRASRARWSCPPRRCG